MARILTYFVLVIAAVICLFPFIWMVSTSFKPMSDIYSMPPTLIPKQSTLENFVEGWKGANFQLYFKNTAVITFLATVGTVLSSSVVAYGFARFQSRLSKILFMVLLGTMMLPTQVTLIPQYLLYYKLGMVDTIWPLIIPSWLGGGAFNIFLFIQFFRTLPKELDEAAKIDGANGFQILLRITLPMIKSTMATTFVIVTLSTLGAFGLVFAMTGGGPAIMTTTLSIFMYQKAFIAYQIGYGMAIALFILAIGILLSLVYIRLIRANDGN